jgi:sulfoxide reductase heme-binding subunit YedZ
MTPTRDPLDLSWWLASRTAGIVALLAMSASVALGLWSATRGVPRRPGQAAALRKLHEHLAIVALGAIGLHGVLLLGDPWLRPGLQGIAVPLAIGYRPLWVACGIVAGWSAALLGLTFYARRRIGAARWRSAHRFTLAAYVLAVVHTLGAGSDAATPWLRALLAAVLLPAVFNLVRRATNPRRSPAPTP